MYPSDVSLNLVGYSDLYFTSCKLDRNSTSGTFHLLGSSLISWYNKKRACVALSIVEAEYIVVGSCCAQTLLLKQQLSDFFLKLTKIHLFCYNTSVINLIKNPVQHLRTKRIKIRHHFIRGHINNGDCEIQIFETRKQLADLFTKPLTKDKFNYSQTELGIIDLTNVLNCWMS